MEEDPRTDYIEKIEVNNFKSYQGLHVIGPFRPFTAVIGPNGSGKSNVMDALSFVLGIDAKKLRSTSIGDLVYDDGRESPKPDDCFVRLTFIDKEAVDHVFTRYIKKKKHGDGSISYRYAYSYNGATDQKSYEAGLESLGVSVTIPNCLVFQGEVESIARKSPKELTALFEYISGSDQFKTEYEQTLRERDVAKENALFLEKKRRGLKVEQREYKDQKKEADVHSKWAREWSELKTRAVLSQLFYVSEDIRDLEAKIQAKAVEEAEVATRMLEEAAKLQKFRSEHSTSVKAFDASERQVKALEQSIERLRSELTVQERKREYLTQNMASAKSESDEAKRRQALGDRKKLQLQRDLDELDSAEAKWKAEQDAALAIGGRVLSDDEMREFAQIKEQARTLTAELRSKLTVLEREQAGDVSVLEQLHDPHVNDLTEKLRIMQDEELPTALRKLDALKSNIARVQEEMERFKTERDALAKENEELIAEKTTLEATLDEIQEKLKSYSVDMRETERQQRMEDCIQTMKRLFPGVHGRIIDLVEPSQERYRPGLSVALGNQIDSIVVSDKDVATDCINYMREQRIGVATFIPLDSIRTGASYDQLRHLEVGVVRPIIDVLKYDSMYQAAIEYVCGSTLICADLEKAREWAFKPNQKRYKVVTYDGMLIAKSGFMTGGVISERSQRWDMKKVTEMKAQRDNTVLRLTELSKLMRNVERERELLSLIAAAEAKLTSYGTDREVAQRAVDRVNKQISDGKQELKATTAVQEQSKATIESRAPKVNALKQEIADAEDGLYSAFSERVGIENIREWDETRRVGLKALAEKGLAFKTQRARIKNLLEYENEQTNRLEQSMTGEDSVQELEASLTRSTREVESMREKLEEMRGELDKEREAFTKLREKMESTDNVLKNQLRNDESRQTLKSSLKKWIERRKAELEQLKTKRHQILDSARTDDVTIPMLSQDPSTSSPTKKKRSTKKSASSMDVDGEENEESDVESEDLPSLRATQSMSAAEIEERTKREDELQIDFSGLEEEFKRCKTQAQRDDKIATITADIQVVRARLDSVMPNFKATDRLGEVGNSIEEVDEAIALAHKQQEDYRQRYIQVREKRKNMFMAAFSKVNENINEVYKALTGGFGQAHFENSVDDPYSQPITYSCCPKQKAWTDIQHLSGGEQSVAALALLFAIQMVRPSPFFILDEIDAALDSDNVGVVAEYFKNKSPTLQFIVISLKDKCFEKADALVGIYQDRASKTSRCVTLDLNEMCGPYRAPALLK